jgi:transporter family-2 protein
MNVSFYLPAIFAGAMLPMQAAINARLGRAVGGPLWAASLSALAVALILAALALGWGKPWPRFSQMGGLPWWAWLGGFCGAVVLSATTAVAPRIGAASMIALVMVGQIIASLTLDGTGLFGMEVQPLSFQRLIAGLLLIAGAIMMGTA